MFSFVSNVGRKAHLLDEVTGAVCALSLNRKLRKAYTGSAYIMQRSSDSTNQTISFLGTGKVDGVTEKSFVGANTGYVTTWYDQSGNARDFTQATQANMPKTYISGTEQTKQGAKSIYFDRTTNPDTLGSAIGDYAQPNTIIFLASVDSITSGNGRIIDSQDGAKRHFIDIASSNVRMSAGTQQDITGANLNLNLYICEFNGASSKIYINGTAYNTPASISTNNINGMYIGRNPANSVFYTGHFVELIMYNRILTQAERLYIQKDFKAFYKIGGA
jgi:hypothetical protein